MEFDEPELPVFPEFPEFPEESDEPDEVLEGDVVVVVPRRAGRGRRRGRR